MAGFFGVSVVTLNTWKKRYPDFLSSLKAGKDEADSKVGEALYQRALGYSHPEVDIKMYKGMIIETEIVKHYPPDTTAAIFWLKNRQKLRWRDQQEIDILPPNAITFVNEVPSPKQSNSGELLPDDTSNTRPATD